MGVKGCPKARYGLRESREGVKSRLSIAGKVNILYMSGAKSMCSIDSQMHTKSMA